jgi:hypothetical protein
VSSPAASRVFTYFIPRPIHLFSSCAKFETNQSGNLTGYSCLYARAAVSKIGSPPGLDFCSAIFVNATGGESPNL